jgi:uroporphyrinogen-III synthase
VPAPAVEGTPEPDVIPNFVAGLQAIGMRATRAPAYRTRLLGRARYAVELELIARGAVDAIAFSSAAEVAGFLAMVDGPEGYRRCLISCFGPYTAANARGMGLEPTIVAGDFSSFDGFADAIAGHLAGGVTP